MNPVFWTTAALGAQLVGGVGSADGPGGVAPETVLALGLAEALGATVNEISLEPDATLGESETEALRAALERTGLFSVVGAQAAQCTLALKRIEEAVVLATALSPGGERLWIGHVTWPPSATSPAGAHRAEQPPTAADDLHQRRLTYRRERLHIRPVTRTWWAPPLFFAVSPGRAWQRGFRWDLAFANPSMTSDLPNDWAVIRGAAQVVDDLALAELLGDQRLAEQVRQARTRQRLVWGGAFGGAALAAFGVGAWLRFAEAPSAAARQDRRAVGVSLVAVGVASAVIALLFPTVGGGHYLHVADAAARVDEYNELRRRELGLSPDDVEGL
jgi:hypothetical protein